MKPDDALMKGRSTPPPKKPHPPGLIKRIDGLSFRFGGEEPSGWLPEGAATPLPTPVRDVVLDLTIESDGAGYLLCFAAADGSICNDYWFERLEDAEKAAAAQFGVHSAQCKSPDFRLPCVEHSSATFPFGRVSGERKMKQIRYR